MARIMRPSRAMYPLSVQPDRLHAWLGPSLLITSLRGECGPESPLTGFYTNEARHLSALRLTVNAEPPWLCQAASPRPDLLSFDFSYPELTSLGGGGSGLAKAEEPADSHGIPFRALNLRLQYRTRVGSLQLVLQVHSCARQEVPVEIAWTVDADFADIQEVDRDSRPAPAATSETSGPRELRFRSRNAAACLFTVISASGPGDWRISASRLISALRLSPRESVTLTLAVQAGKGDAVISPDDAGRRERVRRHWARRMVRVTAPRSAGIEETVGANFRDLSFFPLLSGAEDEWLAPQAGIPLYPALFGRDAITAGWQSAFLDRGESLDATLTALGRIQGTRVDDSRDEQPGRIVQQVRQGPASGGISGRYFGDFSSPFMYVFGLAHLYSWSGDRSTLARHWDSARRIMDWARDYGDRDGDGYLEYLTRSPDGPEHQGWKDSGDAIACDDGRLARGPLGTCEMQGYWYAAQQLMSVLSLIMKSPEDARAWWRSARDLKQRFNRDWWVPDRQCVALAMDGEKRLLPAVTSNAGQCLACGIISEEHLPPLVGRLFAPDMFSGWGIRTLSSEDVAYNPQSYHRGSIWAVENATIIFGLRRFGFDTRALDLSRALFDLAARYPGRRIPECVGGYPRWPHGTPGAYPRTNTVQAWNASAFALVLHSILGLQPVAPLELLVVDPVLPEWLPEITLHHLRLAGATATIRFWRDAHGRSHAEVLHRRGTLRLVRQQPPESLSVHAGDRFRALADSLLHR